MTALRRALSAVFEADSGSSVIPRIAAPFSWPLRCAETNVFAPAACRVSSTTDGLSWRSRSRLPRNRTSRRLRLRGSEKEPNPGQIKTFAFLDGDWLGPADFSERRGRGAGRCRHADFQDLAFLCRMTHEQQHAAGTDVDRERVALQIPDRTGIARVGHNVGTGRHKHAARPTSSMRRRGHLDCIAIRVRAYHEPSSLLRLPRVGPSGSSAAAYSTNYGIVSLHLRRAA